MFGAASKKKYILELNFVVNCRYVIVLLKIPKINVNETSAE
jgi:hypothetical protein